MPVLTRLAAPPPAASTVWLPPLTLPPARLPLPPRAYSSWNRRRHPPRGPLATAADAPRGDPLPEPEERDPLLLAALRAALLRDLESRRPDPLFIDPYAAVLLSHDVVHQDMDFLDSHIVPYPDHYRLATRYIDDKLQNLINSSEDIRQGMDTRPYRLSWPRLSVVYDVSPGRVFSTATEQLREELEQKYREIVYCFTLLLNFLIYKKAYAKMASMGIDSACGYCRGLPLFTLTNLENLLLVISNLAMKGSILVGELPNFPDWTAPMDMGSKHDKLEKLFFTHGFRVSFVHYNNVAKDIGLDLAPTCEKCGRVLFVAEQLRFSDAQMESFRMHFERIEEDADEEGFEEL
ncbi:hypothetical protein ACP70R_023345 [Stipagrostis hirtigluma subsp. patula]